MCTQQNVEASLYKGGLIKLLNIYLIFMARAVTYDIPPSQRWLQGSVELTVSDDLWEIEFTMKKNSDGKLISVAI